MIFALLMSGILANEPVLLLDSMDSVDNWESQAIVLAASADSVEGKGSLNFSGAGYARLKATAFQGIEVGKYDRLVMNVKILDGHVTEFGLVTLGFPQPGEFSGVPRWAKYDESTPAGKWMEYSCDLHLCEWPGGSPEMLNNSRPALSLVFTPGKGNSGILVDHLRLVKDPIRVGYDWLEPVRPLRIKWDGGQIFYEKEFEVENASNGKADVKVRFSGESVRKFMGTLKPVGASLLPGEKAVFTASFRPVVGLKALEVETQVIEIIPNDNEKLIQRREILTAAPFPPVRHPFTVKEVKAGQHSEGLLKEFENVRLPKGPCVWMGQSTLNSKGRCEDGHQGQTFSGFDRLKCDTCGKVQEATSLTGGLFHRHMFEAAKQLGMAYQSTRDIRYARKVREIFLAYAEGYHKYPMRMPLTEASSYLCPGNATYVLGTVVMTPMTRALDLVWDSGAFTTVDKEKILDGFLMPAAMEMMKINPGMTNMQDAINESLFNLGATIGDPNLVAQSLFGSHGLEAKINSVVDEDGATPESVSPGYHNAAIVPVLNQVEAILNSGLNVDLKFGRLEKAKTLMNFLRMPDGRIPNRGDSGFPAGRIDEELHGYGSMSFTHFGMTILREGTGVDALYLAIDHRPPAVTHSHHDKLGIIFYGMGEYLGVDEGSTYNTDTTKQNGLPNWPKRAKWSHHSLVHNTITVDETDQVYGGARLLYFHGEKESYQAVAASTDNVYRGVVLERSVVMLGGVVVMVDRCLSGEEHTYDWAHHSFGSLNGPAGLKPRETLGTKHPYNLPEDVLWGVSEGDSVFTWKREKASLSLRVLSESDTPTESATATGWANRAYKDARHEAPFALVRRKGKNVTFVTVFEPFKDKPSVTNIQRLEVFSGEKKLDNAQALGIRLEKGGETITYLFSFVEGAIKCGNITTSERCFGLKEQTR
ncbi:MAG: heparinase II/III family protein [Planctomycetota bacterium]|nr:heparinase II/III family protein [Planctomycetota bacterium]